MKTKQRTIVILLVVLVVLAGLWAVLKSTGGEPDSSGSSATDGTMLVGGSPDDITDIELTADGRTLSLHQTAQTDSSSSSSSSGSGSGVWSCPAQPGLPVDQTKAASLASTLTGLSANRCLADADPAGYGLDAPRWSIAVTRGDDHVTLLVGDANATTGDVYVMLKGDSAVYTVSDFTSQLPAGELDLVQLETLPEAGLEKVTALSFQSEQGAVRLTYYADGVPGTGGMRHWQVEQNGETWTADDEGAESLLRELVSVQFSSCAAWNTDDLAAYGLDNPAGSLTVEYTTVTETGETDENGSAVTTETPAQYTLLFGGKTDDGMYAMQQGGTQVGLVSADLLDGLTGLTPESLLPTVVCNVPMTGLNSFTVTSEGVAETFTVTRVVNTDEEGVSSTDESWARTGGELDESALFNFYGDLCSLALEKPGAVQPQNADSFRVDFAFTNGDTASLKLSVYDSSFYSAEFMGQSIGLVNRRDVESLQKEFMALLG